MSRRGLPVVYRIWLGGALLSQLGDAALYFALGWAASGFDGSAAGLVLSAIVLPRTVLLLLGGVVGDRAGARAVMITGDAVMLGVSGVLAVVAYRWGTPLPLLIAAALVIGVVDAFYLPSLGSMPRRLVGDDQLSRAVAVRQGGGQLMTMVGGPIGGVLVAAAGFGAAAGADAVSFAAVLIVLICIRPSIPAPVSRQAESTLRSAAEGLRTVWVTPGLRSALLLVAGAAGFVIPCTSLVVPLLARQHQWGATTAGLVVGASGVGVIIATAVVARRGAATRPGLASAAGLATTAAGQLLVAVTQPTPVVIGCGALIGLGSGTFVANLAPVLLGTAPRTHLARVQSVLSLVQSGALLMTVNLLGAVAHGLSASVAMLCCASAVLTCACVACATPALRQLGHSVTNAHSVGSTAAMAGTEG